MTKSILKRYCGIAQPMTRLDKKQHRVIKKLTPKHTCTSCVCIICVYNRCMMCINNYVYIYIL